MPNSIVSLRSVTNRIRRKLAREGQRLRIVHARSLNIEGPNYIIDKSGEIVEANLELATLIKRLKILSPGESIQD